MAVITDITSYEEVAGSTIGDKIRKMLATAEIIGYVDLRYEIRPVLYNDNRTDPSAPFLQVTGYICNFGTNTANNCVLHVSATQNDNSQAIDSSANIESIQAGNYIKIDIKFPLPR